MGVGRADEKGVVVACAACGQKNRVGYANLGRDGKCGRCAEDLPRLAAPIDVSSEAAFENLIRETTLPVLVDFWAAWCGPCVMVAPELVKLAERDAGHLIVAKVDTEDLPVLGQRLHITSIPTMALYVGGREIAKTQGARPAEGIRAFVEESLARGRATR